MATVTTHLLNSVDGTHAGGVGTRLFRIGSSRGHTLSFEGETDFGGRLAATVEISNQGPDAEFELVFQTGFYFATHHCDRADRQILKEVVIRFSMPDPNGKYHIPLMIAPNSYSVWWSS